MELQRKETKEMLDDLTTRDQRMMFGILTMVHLADSKKQLDSDTELILSIARKHLCQMATLKWQQVDGLNTVLPYGLRKINALRTLTTESTAVLIPFHTQEILQPGRYLLWAECSQQEPSGSRPEETDEWKQFPVGRQWIRKELFGKRRDCASGIEYR